MLLIVASTAQVRILLQLLKLPVDPTLLECVLLFLFMLRQQLRRFEATELILKKVF
jgi:hypothetical protein